MLALNCNESQIACDPECPDLYKINEAKEHIACIWQDEVADPDKIWDRYLITWSNTEIWIKGRQRYGATYHDARQILIWYPYPCDTPGLCPGVFDWELGLTLTESILPNSTELEKLEFRQDKGLFNELLQECQ